MRKKYSLELKFKGLNLHVEGIYVVHPPNLKIIHRKVYTETAEEFEMEKIVYIDEDDVSVDVTNLLFVLGDDFEISELEAELIKTIKTNNA